MNKIRKPLDLTKGTSEVALIMSEGSPEAMTVISKIFARFDDLLEKIMPLVYLDDMNIRGTQIWIGYKDYCKEDIELFVKNIEDRNKDMVNFINLNHYRQGGRDKAVMYGASFRSYEFFNSEDIKGFNGGRGEGE